MWGWVTTYCTREGRMLQSMTKSLHSVLSPAMFPKAHTAWGAKQLLRWVRQTGVCSKQIWVYLVGLLLAVPYSTNDCQLDNNWLTEGSKEKNNWYVWSQSTCSCTSSKSELSISMKMGTAPAWITTWVWWDVPDAMLVNTHAASN